MSRAFHNYRRLGETQPELLVATELDTIDASLFDTSLRGHSYIGDVQSIVSDLHDLVVGGKRAIERLGLETIHRNALEYWSIKPEVQTANDAALGGRRANRFLRSCRPWGWPSGCDRDGQARHWPHRRR